LLAQEKTGEKDSEESGSHLSRGTPSLPGPCTHSDAIRLSQNIYSTTVSTDGTADLQPWPASGNRRLIASLAPAEVLPDV
ncbi:hypothetical protein JZ751_014262, partial [Albula glossodonta]